ncbi:hypothetical protein GWI33_012412 [Rhynchophorus ferrugineus]|uniref:Uncharacterized protein n=1 Tax=Rhynchophorus ferrugineus TaxID=354439 RepID=A0A834I8Y3_RHYFE|nr:hypothetical protein GWI33_012412 [Rhynchophorus ferrugineus]
MKKIQITPPHPPTDATTPSHPAERKNKTMQKTSGSRANKFDVRKEKMKRNYPYEKSIKFAPILIATRPALPFH